MRYKQKMGKKNAILVNLGKPIYGSEVAQLQKKNFGETLHSNT